MARYTDDFTIADSIANSVIDNLPASISAIDELVKAIEAAPDVRPDALRSVEAVYESLGQLLDSVETQSLEVLTKTTSIAPESVELRSLEMVSGTARFALEECRGHVIQDLPPALAAIEGLVQTLEKMPATQPIARSVETIYDSAADALKTLETISRSK